MLEDSGRIRDKAKISELPTHEQISYQVFVLQQVVMGLLRLLKEPLLNRTANIEVERDRNITEMSLHTQGTVKNLMPSPREVRDMVPPEDYWFLNGPLSVEDLASDRQARELVKAFLGVSDRIT
jgi:hypothetical protein